MPRRALAKVVLRWLLTIVMVGIGVDHFVDPETFMKIVPSMLPAPRELVLVSGFFEILGGIGLVVPWTRKWAGWGLIALYVSVFAANINMAVNKIQIGPTPIPEVLLWLRLPFQGVFIAWAWWVSRPDTTDEKGEAK